MFWISSVNYVSILSRIRHVTCKYYLVPNSPNVSKRIVQNRVTLYPSFEETCKCLWGKVAYFTMPQGDICPRDAGMIGQTNKDQIIDIHGQDIRIYSMDSLEWLLRKWISCRVHLLFRATVLGIISHAIFQSKIFSISCILSFHKYFKSCFDGGPESSNLWEWPKT